MEVVVELDLWVGGRGEDLWRMVGVEVVVTSSGMVAPYYIVVRCPSGILEVEIVVIDSRHWY